MRKILTCLAVAVAMVAFGSVTQAKAQVAEGSTMGTIGGTSYSVVAGGALFAGTTLGIVYLVYDDYMNKGGKNRRLVEVVPGAGFQSRDYDTAARLTHEFNVAMGREDDVDTARYLASALRQ